MKYDIVKRHRRSIRLKGFDYRQPGGYFITAVIKDRVCLFGEIVNGQIRLNDTGRIIQAVWNDLPSHYPDVELNAFVVMPNHVHGVIVLVDDGGVGRGAVGAGLKPAPTRHGVPEIVRAFKTFSARRVNEARKTPGVPIWQRNYYEHVIRSDEVLTRIREYIANNPTQWDLDRENPLRLLHTSTRKAEPWEV